MPTGGGGGGGSGAPHLQGGDPQPRRVGDLRPDPGAPQGGGKQGGAGGAKSQAPLRRLWLHQQGVSHEMLERLFSFVSNMIIFSFFVLLIWKFHQRG